MRTVAEVAKTGAPTLVMSYWNPIEQFGVERFAEDLAAAGGVGTITADIIPEEAGEWITAATKHGLDRVFLVAPSSSDERIKATTEAASGIRLCRGRDGCHRCPSPGGSGGARPRRADQGVHRRPSLRGAGRLVLVAQAAEIAEFADGVIVGSAFVRLLLDAASVDEGVTAVRQLAKELAVGVRAGAGCSSQLGEGTRCPKK